MNTRILKCSFAAALLAAGVGSALAATTGSRAAIDVQYQQERSACMSGRSGEDQSTCLKEAGAARAEALRGMNLNAVGTDYRQNELERCKIFTDPADARECRMRIEQGSVSGSVRDGGVLRELSTTVQTGPTLIVVPVQPAPAAPADEPAPQN